jgi:hypothetical protein
VAISITCPAEAQMYLRGVLLTYPPHGLAALVQAFLKGNKISEQKIREVAAAKRVTLTAVVRALMLQKYPDLKPLWPARVATPAQLAGILGRTLPPNMQANAALQTAVSILAALVEDRDNGQAMRRAREFLAKYRD